MSSHPIGFFDSGIGGTTLWKKITSLLPNENTIYISDKKNCPYGEKSKKEIDEISIYNSQFLIDRNCKIIVVACNTATTNSISKLRKKFKVPFYRSSKYLLKNNKPDAVIVATPNQFHEKHTISFLNEKIPVLLEKPISNSI